MSKRSVSLPTFVCVLLIVAMAASTLTLLLTGARTAAPEARGRAAQPRGGDLRSG